MIFQREPTSSLVHGVLRIKRYPDGRVNKFKARFCARGDKQIEGVDYFEKFAPVVSWTTVRTLMVLSLNLGWVTKQVDFSNAFCQATLNEEIYITLPSYFESEEGFTSHDACLKLNKSLYGLVQSPMYWFNFISKVFEDKGFRPSTHDQCLFYGRGFMILVYVDDCLFFGPDEGAINAFISELEEDGLSLTREEDAFNFLGVQVVSQPDGTVELLQTGLIQKILDTMHLSEADKCKTPAG